MKAPLQTATGGPDMPVEGLSVGRRLGLPELPSTGRLPGRDDIRYVVTGRSDGTMSASHGIGDAPDRGAPANRSAALRVLDLTPAQVGFMRQVHGAAVALAAPAQVTEDQDPPTADAIVSTAAGCAVAVQVADCVPVLLVAGDAVAAVHAGRAGVVADVVGEAVKQVSSHGGVPTSAVTAIIGPAIGPCCYEVPRGMADTIGAMIPATIASTSWGTPSLDLPAAVASQLRRHSVAQVFATGGCTLHNPAQWFSHRATDLANGGWADGRQMAVIVREAP